MPDTARVMLLREFGKALEPAELPVPQLEPGGLLVRIAAAGICGSDLEIIARRDPRVGADLLPLIPGHEGVGWVEAMSGSREDLTGRQVARGDLIVWNRGVTCGRCRYCSVRRERFLCPYRQVYGITMAARAPTWLNGCYAEMLYVRPASEVVVLPRDTDPALVVPATCSGATAAHAVELSGVALGDRVLVIGPGPLGLFCAALAQARGAGEVFVSGTERSRRRLEAAAAWGCRPMLADELDAWKGPPFDVVLDAAGTARSVMQAVAVAGPGATVALPGVAAPLGSVCLRVYEDIARKNLRLQGVWVSDARHLLEAVQVVVSGRWPLDRLVTHRFALSEVNQALAAVESRVALKAVVIPD